MARDQDADDSVYDFLYVDARRIAQFLSQFNQYGHLTGLTRTANETRSGGGGINIGAAKVDKTTQAGEGQTKQFDPQWLNPLTFLDEASAKGMIVRDTDAAGIGQLVLFSGKLGIFDVAIFKALWGAENLIEKAMSGTSGQPDQPAGNRHERRSQRAEGRLAPVSDQAKFAKALLPSLPHLVQGSIYDKNKTFWFSLKDEFMTTPASELLLKHSVCIPGVWNAVGILDARPNDGASAESVEVAIDHFEASSKFGTLGDAIRDISQASRNMMGRPDSSYGLTPLLIFREVAG